MGEVGGQGERGERGGSYTNKHSLEYPGSPEWE